MTQQPFEYYLDLIRNGEVLTDIEISNAKNLHKRGYNNKDYERCLAVVRRNRDYNDGWNDWYYRRYVRTFDEELK